MFPEYCRCVAPLSRWCYAAPTDARVRDRTAASGHERLATRRSRLLAAGLDLLGAEQQDISTLTVRGICRRGRAGSPLLLRKLHRQRRIHRRGLRLGGRRTGRHHPGRDGRGTAVARAMRAGMANIVRAIDKDARVGRLLFSTQLANRSSCASAPNPAHCSPCCPASTLETRCRCRQTTDIKAAAHFVVGGVGQTISAWLAGDVKLNPDQLVDQLASLLDELADPKLALPRVTEIAAAGADSPRDPAATDASS